MVRRCPRCQIDLRVRTQAGVEVDVCDRCSGLFLDASEFDRLIAERFERKRVESMFELTAEESSEPLPCPAGCTDAMQVVDYRDVDLDRCSECGGIWIDGEERGRIARPVNDDVPLEEYVDCVGCGVRVTRRLCIRRMDAWWCEECVVAGNHPGVEAQLVGQREREFAAINAFAQAKAAQAQTREAIAERKRMAAARLRVRALGVYDPGFLDIIRIAIQKLWRDP